MRKHNNWTDEQLIQAVKDSFSYSNVLKLIGVKICGGTWAKVKLRIKQLSLDVSHFTGKGWCVGEKYDKFCKKHNTIPIEKILVKNSSYQNTHRLKARLLKLGLLRNECHVCQQQPIWNNKILSLQLDHEDGDRNNNTIENLRIICPNCHSQTDTFAGKNKFRPSGGTHTHDTQNVADESS